MVFLQDLLDNKIFWVAASAWLIAQILKTVIHLIISKKFVAERLVGGGGMPSSHSATVCALATAVAIEYGASSVEFALALILAIVVMYDAMGVRRETGNQAKIINEMMNTLNKLGEDISPEEKLKEFVGHSPFQVIIGAILGILIANIIYFWL